MANKTIKTPVEQILEITKNASGHPVDVCASLIDYMESSEDPVTLLQTILEYPDSIGDPDDHAPQIISLEELKKFVHRYFSYIILTVRLLARKNLPENDYYTRLYDIIFADECGILGRSRTEKAVYLEMMANHIKELPYYRLNMKDDISDSDFQDTVHKLFPELQKAAHIFQRDLETNTMQGRLLADQFQQLETEKERAVFMTVLINIIRSKYGADNSED